MVNEKDAAKIAERNERKKLLVEGKRIQAVIRAANEKQNPLEDLAPCFHTFNKNGLDLRFEACPVSSLDEATKNWVCDLTKRNMQTHYELQLESSVQRKGLGKFMMQLLQLISFKNQMKRVMVTVFKHNESAVAFYRNLGYTEDDTNPEDDEYEEEYFDYFILSKSTLPKSKQ